MRARRRPAAGRGDVVPYDYGAVFRISGRPGNVVQSVINTAPDSLFVAVAIGYGFEEDRGRPLTFEPAAQPGELPAGMVRLGDITLDDLPASALLQGFRVNPRFKQQVFGFDSVGENASVPERGFSDDPVPAAQLRQDSFFQQVKSPAEITFLFSMLDSGTGRELQDEPVHNIASLGKSDGERPFRLLAQPITFLPRTTMRLQIVERSQDVRGNLFVVFYGYQVVGSSGCPELLVRQRTGTPLCPTETIGHPSARVIPFDYVTTFQLTGRPQNVIESETTVNAEGGFVASSIGYGLLVEENDVLIDRSVFTLGPPQGGGLIDLARITLRQFPTSALLDGIRIRPELARLAFKDNGQLANQFPITSLDELFERLNRPEDVSFRYAIFDSGRGRDLQNQPLHNIAGLGSADGDRPFKRLARSMIFQPRSTIRMRVEERFGRGTLFIVLQGYKVLATGAAR